MEQQGHDLERRRGGEGAGQHGDPGRDSAGSRVSRGPVTQVAPEIFRAYDIRGIVGEQIDEGVAYRLGRGVATLLDRKGTPGPVIVGRDNRLSSPVLAAAVARGLSEGGREVLDLGTVTTPLFYYARVHLGVQAGVMVTASHNPAAYNGMKILRGESTIYGPEIQELRRIVEEAEAAGAEGGAPPPATPGGRRAPWREAPVAEAYLAMLAGKLRLEGRPLKVAVDCGNGTASLFAVEFLKRIGVKEVVPLFCESDGRFPHHHPDPVVAENLVELRATVLREGCDVGVAYDGDADRLGVIDDRGEILWGDQLMILFWREILPRHPGTPAIIEVKCSQALVEEVERLGGRPLFYRTGHSFIKAKMRELGAVFTGEMSGHMFFADEYYGFDDAFYATGRLLRIVARSGRRLSELMADVPRYPSTGETRIPVPEEAKERVVGQLAAFFRERYPVVDVDGVRVLFPDGWALVRASNTQEVLVARCEGKDGDALLRICRELEAALARFPEVATFHWA